MDGTGNLFTPFLRALPDSITPVVVSYPPDKPLDYAGHLDYVMAALPDNEPFVLLGESFSGPLALMAAARKPKGLKGIILCDTFVSYPLAVPAFVTRLVVHSGIFRLKAIPLIQWLLLGKNAGAELKALFSEALSRVRPEVFAARAKAILSVDCSMELRQCPVPVLALVAEQDRIITKKCSEQIRSICPDITFVRMNSPHLILQCVTAEAVRVIVDFWDTLAAT